MNEKKMNKTQIIVFFAVLFLVAGMSMYGQDIIPSQVKTTLESVRDAFTGDMARIIVGICFAGSCIAYAYNKDNEKMKSKMIAVMIAMGLLVMSQTIVDSVSKIGA